MEINEEILNAVKNIFSQSDNSLLIGSGFVQYHHVGNCDKPCNDCIDNDNRIFEVENQIKTPVHPFCDCYNSEVPTITAAEVSIIAYLQNPAIHLKLFGTLPDYYITKERAIQDFGWDRRRNTIAGKAPGMMIGGNVFANRDKVLPVKEGRIWYECDVDYTSGGRNSKRLFYSNDGLMFYSPDHGQKEFYLVI